MARVFSFVEGVSSLRAGLGTLRRGRPLYAAYPADLWRGLRSCAAQAVLHDLRSTLRAIRWKNRDRSDLSLDTIR